jgi:hypothetical protein
VPKQSLITNRDTSDIVISPHPFTPAPGDLSQSPPPGEELSGNILEVHLNKPPATTLRMPNSLAESITSEKVQTPAFGSKMRDMFKKNNITATKLSSNSIHKYMYYRGGGAASV